MTVLTTIAVVVFHTPIWVWALYALLLLLGIRRTRDNTIQLWRMLILPIAVALLTISTFIGAGPNGMPAAVIGFALGTAIGWQFERDGDTLRQPDGRLWLRGEWLSFLQLLLVLSLRYAMNLAPILSPPLASDPTWCFDTMFISAGLSAVFLGRTAARLRAYFSAVPVAAAK